MAKRAGKPRSRKPGVTRDRLLSAAFEEIYRRGYQATSLEAILARAGVTKGALYHHFSDKAALGHAVLDEVVSAFLLERWGVDQLKDLKGDPVTALQDILQRRSAELGVGELALGCPLNNLAQEMSPLDERFRRKIRGTFATWIEAFARALERGQKEGSVRRELDAKVVAQFIVAAIEGSFGLAKAARSPSLLRSNLDVLVGFLEGLRRSSS